jgi:hypothetical protein
VKEQISQDVICPECGDNILIDIKDFKINLFGCKNDHKKVNILLNKYENMQKIDLTKIICNQCNKSNYNDNNDFYICYTCNKNICHTCHSNHESHAIIKYDDKNYICKKHRESFIKFCENCKEDLCMICGNEHINHKIIDLGNLLLDKNDLTKEMEILKLVIDRFKNKIETIKGMLNGMINILQTYYRISNNIIKNYNMNKRFYIKLVNLNNLKSINNNLINDLNNIINDDSMHNLFQFSFNKFYNENGEKYIGEMKNGLKDGKGVFYFNKKDKFQRKIYEGEF